MIVSRGLHLIAVALASFDNLEPKRNRALFRFAENSSEALLATPLQLCILRLHSIRRLKKRPDKRLPEPRPARQGGR